VKHQSQAAKRRSGNQHAAARRETRREKDAARAASATPPQSPNIAPMKGTEIRQEKEMREARKKGAQS
jgi:hypothetical protein